MTTAAPTYRRRTGALVGAGLAACVVIAGLVAYAVIPPRQLAKAPVASSGPGKGLPVVADGKRAPGFTLPRLGGGPPVTLAADRGHPVVLNFFASWCTDCRAELKAFAAVSARPGDVRFVGVDTNDSFPAKAESLLRSAGDRYPVGVDASAKVANGGYLIQALPVTVFIGSDGRVAGEVFGTQTVGSLRPWMRRLQESVHG